MNLIILWYRNYSTKVLRWLLFQVQYDFLLVGKVGIG